MHIGQLIDRRYQVTKIIAHDGFGETGIAIDTKFPGKPLGAVKQLSPKNDHPQALVIAKRLKDEDAIADYNQAIEINPNNSASYRNRGVLH